ncbi:MAG: lipoyl(octanoyl) transferase [Desulfobulbus propionicus]|nr:MAG: lipoyl(octanoyl) transferase [Desulfobulbus propionicus]
MPASWTDLGLMEYKKACKLQTDLVNACRQDKEAGFFLILEHMPVYTLGRRGGLANLAVTPAFAASQGIDLVQVERGGDITYHGPGQIILYPIISLHHFRLSVRGYIGILEEIMLRTARDYNIQAKRDVRSHGIWVRDQKMGSLGVAIRHGVTSHGLGLNIQTDLKPFTWINPCGLTHTAMTSFFEQTGDRCNIEEVKAVMKNHCETLFRLKIRETFPHTPVHESLTSPACLPNSVAPVTSYTSETETP